jgi:hypothetical protein
VDVAVVVCSDRRLAVAVRIDVRLAGPDAPADVGADGTKSVADVAATSRRHPVAGVVTGGRTGQMPHVEEDRPGDGGGVGGAELRLDGGVPDPHRHEAVEAPEGRPVADCDPGDQMVKMIMAYGRGGCRPCRCRYEFDHCGSRGSSKSIGRPPGTGAARI